MSKFAKIFIGIVAFVVIAVGIAIWVFISNINEVAKRGIEHYGSEALGAQVRVDQVGLSLFGGSGSIKGLHIANPKGFSEAEAFTLGLIHLALETSSLAKPVLVIEDVTVEGARLFVEQHGKQGNNLDALRKHAEAYAGGEKRAPDEQSAERRLAIKSFNFLDAEVTVRAKGLGEQHVELPDIRLTDIGDARSGVSIAEAVGRMLKPIVSTTIRDALKQKLEGSIRSEVDKVIDSNDQLRSLKGLIGNIGSPPDEN